MLPPVLEVYVAWHPQDDAGKVIATEFVEHFHGTAFSGLIGGAVEVYARSCGWRSREDAPRALPVDPAMPPNGVERAKFVAVVPVLGNGMAEAVQQPSFWREYVAALQGAQRAEPQSIFIAPYILHSAAMHGTYLAQLLGGYQAIGKGPIDHADTERSARCRDLSQSLAQFVAGDPRRQLRVFISHTKRSSDSERGNVIQLIELVRDVIGATRLGEFFDANDLQAGTDWSAELHEHASDSAFLALRSDLYPTREWCQKEMMVAKVSGMPVVIVDAVGFAEERGSFLMDHVPRVPVHVSDDGWSRRDVFKALNLLVNECLKRELWRQQQVLTGPRDDLDISWWAPHAPEPLTLIDWLGRTASTKNNPLRILHPDPPLGPDEKAVLQQMLRVCGRPETLDVMTPRQLAGRGG